MDYMDRSVGSLALLRSGKTQTQIGRECGVSTVTAHHWVTGERKPGDKKRLLLDRLYGIAPPAWDEAAPKEDLRDAAPVAPPAPKEEKEVPMTAYDMAHELQASARQLMQRIRSAAADARVTPLEHAKVMAACSTVVVSLAKVTGQADPKTALSRNPLFLQIVIEVEAVLKKHNLTDVAKEIAERVEALESAR
ncbi:MAG: XRE family transcriptional regulator [Hyphomicrobiaceae bacterium]|nr:MAG: XRE family transcriptional regulator [Hyphomicrobiaceae bacterium]